MKTLRFMKRAAAPLLAAVLVIGASAGPASSYFTTYVTAQGGKVLDLEFSHIETHEEVDANVKTISVLNTGEVECYVRVKLVSASDVSIDFSGDSWFDGHDGYWYCTTILQPGESSGPLTAKINLPTSSPERPIPEGTELNVEVISESAKVLYDEDFTARPNGPEYDGWDLMAKEG